jgi:hypothetical protein
MITELIERVFVSINQKIRKKIKKSQKSNLFSFNLIDNLKYFHENQLLYVKPILIKKELRSGFLFFT